MEYILHILILVCFYTLLSQSLNLSAGHTGLISLAQAGFYGIGAYTTAILATQYGLSFWINLPIAMMISGAVAFATSLIAVRTVDDYFIICTLAIQVILFSLMNNWVSLTNGPFGIPGIPSIHLFGIDTSEKLPFLILSLCFVSFCWFLLRNLSQSGFGNTLKAISEDEIYVHSIGKNANWFKIVSFTITAVFAAVPGALQAHYISFIDPSGFTINESILVLSIVIIGGWGNFTGSFFASAFLVLLPELLRFIGISDRNAINLRQIIYGLILVLIVTTSKKRFNLSYFRKGKP